MASVMQRADVLVVGAGLAGLWCSRLLAGAGLSVVLVDDRDNVDRRIRTTGIFVRRTLEDFALPAEYFGPEIRRVELYSPAHRRLTLESSRPEFRVARVGPLSRWLLSGAREAGVEWRPATRCEGLTAEGVGSVARLRGPGGGLVRARFVIGADGARSRVAEWLDLSANREWIVGLEEVYAGIPLSGPPAFHCVLSSRLAPGYLAWAIEDGEEVHLGVGGHGAGFDPSGALAAFRKELPVALDLARGKLVDRRGGRIPVGGILPRIANRRGLLVGDAAGAVSPLTAGGIDPCFRLSELAAKVTLEYLRHGDSTPSTTYDGARFRRRFRSRLALRNLLTRLNRPLLLEVVCASLRAPFLTPLARKVFFGRGSFPDVDRCPAGGLARSPAEMRPPSRSSA
jgi:flavin-dependent dehydrogenase